MSETKTMTLNVTGYSGDKLIAAEFPKGLFLSPRLKGAGTTADKVPAGIIQAEIYTSEKGWSSVNSFNVINATGPTKEIAPPAGTAGGWKKGGFKGGDSGLTKEERARKDLSMNITAIWKSTFESPAFSTVSLGNTHEEIASKLISTAKRAADEYIVYLNSKLNEVKPNV